MVFDDARVNTGGHNDNTTGVYTVPINGTCESIFHMYTYDDNTCAALLEVDNIQVDLSNLLIK